MLSGAAFLTSFVVVIALMIVAISVLHIHPFLSIIAAAFTLGALCLDLNTTLDVMLQGFSGTFITIGLIVIMGTLIGLVQEHTGAALKMSDSIVKTFGPKHPNASLAVTGWIASISVFCDSGFVILNPVRRAIVKRLQISSVSATVALSTGLFISHCLVPPTPGPVAAVGILGIEHNMLLVMAFGVVVSIPALVATCLFARYIGKHVKDRTELNQKNNNVTKTYEELVASYGKLPNAFLSFLPILLPIVLMGGSSVCSLAKINAPLLIFLGKPVVALPIGFIASLPLLVVSNKLKDLYDLTNEALMTSGPILFITAAGGTLGKIVSAGPLIPFLTEYTNVLSSLGLFFPFIFAAILKSSQGSSTVAITTTSGIVAPMLVQLGLDSPALNALLVTAIGAGAMTVSHVNDSLFWVVVKFGELTKTIDGYKSHVLGTAIAGLTSIITVFIISLFLH